MQTEKKGKGGPAVEESQGNTELPSPPPHPSQQPWRIEGKEGLVAKDYGGEE